MLGMLAKTGEDGLDGRSLPDASDGGTPFALLVRLKAGPWAVRAKGSIPIACQTACCLV